MIKKLLAVLLGALSVFVYMTAYAASVSQDISGGILRFHILANSDSEYDQRIKLEVRDYVCQGLRDCGELSPEYIKKIGTLADERLSQLGAPYRSQVSLKRTFVPKKSYKNITLPSGIYNAAQLVLGEGEGQNWWCVAYPPLCFTEEFSGSLTREGEEILKQSMSENAYRLISEEAEYSLWVVDFVQGLIN